jgi:hypothetical protein
MITKIITGILAFFAKKSHNLKTQVLLASVYGLVAIFGVGGTIQIMLKMRAQAEKERKLHGKTNG